MSETTQPDVSSKPRTLRRRERLADVLARRQPDMTLVLANIHDPHNVSAIYRSCDAFGVGRVHLYYTHAPFPQLGRKSSASAREWVESARFSDSDALFQTLRDKGMQVLATSCSSRAVPLLVWDFTRPTVVIMGNEHGGVDKELLKRADGELYIPMYGMIQSFNVSVAAAVILAEMARQRDAAGMYAAPRMRDEEIAAKLDEWLKK
ncbi:MAG: tRNA methyltransferase [Desulfovibrio sp.]|jgi:tRNA (guanosine-2'-O-)-methyltransferase|nr:tRNA methyltransferase [Desulfovibrio sp.]